MPTARAGSTSFGAVAPGTDLSVYARELRRVHDAMLGGAAPPRRPRAVVARSWERMLALGLDPDGAGARDPLPRADVEHRRRASPLTWVIDDLRRALTSVADASRFLLVVTDADGVILWREGASAVRRRADGLGFSEGALWTESQVGTNAIGTAIAEQAPVQLFSAEHFEAQQHAWYCTAMPIHDPRTGDLLGVVDVSGPALTLHPAITALVETAVRLAEARLAQLHAERLERLRRDCDHLIGTSTGPLLVVDDDGWVAHRSGIAVRERIAVPRPETTVAVPGLGVCLPERLDGGWLVRPSDAERRLRLRLHRSGLEPVLEVTSGSESWRRALSPRHADILVRLAAAGSAGLTPAALSRQLFGDESHLVTVRAEISRMRRVLGAMLASAPYRIAEEVDLEVVPSG
ncbi:GAF domain-containing protein [Nocardioides zeae]|uniref:GAF domain-containing protein n=1 Tax=Nocardioides imazamoxiresistens TaxID=3231893 RepID=A0ABU3PVL2_9ACTN|nr:GAF domain-containing protein [Nocardioides zeae]MDT9592785.1 GAF domain-containing protein [Nocardioides zeae]